MTAVPKSPVIGPGHPIDVTATARTLPAFSGHERVWAVHYPPSGLHSFIAVHDTTLGPALGGCRMWPYSSEKKAMTDALRLSRGMTFKAALAGLYLGGGKAVIIGDPKTGKTVELMHDFGIMVENLDGRYITAEDVGISVEDADLMAERTSHVVGTSRGRGDPSPMTALGVCEGIKTAVHHRLGSDTLRGLTVAVQGLGHVGYNLAERLSAEGARLIVADIDPEPVARAVDGFGASAVSPDEIHAVSADVFAPNALGAVVNDRSIGQVRAAIVAGAANNQLADKRHGEALHRRGILYAPDFVVNAGGLISVASEADGKTLDDARVSTLVRRIGATLAEIFVRAEAENLPPGLIAERLADERIERHRHQGNGKVV